jgi:hypothetical protein
VRQRDAGNFDTRTFLRNTHWNRAVALLALDHPADALKDWDRALELERKDEDQTTLRMSRALTLTHLGKYEEAVSVAEELAGPPERASITIYPAACVFSRASAAVGLDTKRTAADRRQLAEQYAARAVALLRRSQSQGYFKEPANLATLKQDKDLDPLRSRDDFQKLLRELQE